MFSPSEPAKRANVGVGPHPASISPEHASFNQDLKAQMLRKILRIGLTGAGIGVGTGLLARLLGRQSIPTVPADDPDVDFPYPQVSKQASPLGAMEIAQLALSPAVGAGVGAAYGAARNPRDSLAGSMYGGLHGLGQGMATGAGYVGTRRLAMRLAEAAGAAQGGAGSRLAGLLAGLTGGAVGNRLGGAVSDSFMGATVGPPPWEHHRKKADWADATVRNVLPTPAGEPTPAFGSPRWVRGDTMTRGSSMPWAIPAAAAAGFGGMFGGNALVRYLLKRRHKARLEAEVEAAKREYESAMLGQYDPKKIHDLGGKTASAVNRLDAVYEAVEKRGFDVNNILGNAGGLYLLYALAAGGLTGMGTYRFLQGRAKSKLLQDALKQRALARQMSNPPDVFLHPTPARLSGDQLEADGEDAADPIKTLPV